MAWKTIKLQGWFLSFERESLWYARYNGVSGFQSIDVIEIDGLKTDCKKHDFAVSDAERKIVSYPNNTLGIKCRKRMMCRSFKINVAEFVPEKLKFYYADVIIKIGDEEIDTCKRIISKVTYNGRNCNLNYESRNETEYETVIWHKSPFIYDNCGIYNEGLVPAKLNGWYGFVDKNGKVVIPFEYNDAEEFSNGLAPVVEVDDKWSFIDKTGHNVLVTDYYTVHNFKEGRAFVQNKRNSWYFGFIDENGNEIVSCVYRYQYNGTVLYYHHDYSDGLALVGNDKFFFGYIDKDGNKVTSIDYNWAEQLCEGLGTVCKKGKWGYVDNTGTEVIPLTYSKAKSFSEGLAAVKMDNKWGFIDKTNSLVIPFKYKEVSSFSEGLAAVMVNKKWGFIDKSGKNVIPCEYGCVFGFYEGMAAVSKNGKWGYVDMSGQLIVPCKYNYTDDFRHGLAVVKLKDKYGCIDKTGKVVIPIVYDSIGVYEDVIVAELNEKYGLLDFEGNFIEDNSVYKSLSKKYDAVFIDNGEERTYSIALDGKWGLADKDGNVLVEP